MGLLRPSKNAGVSCLRYWNEGAQLNKGSHIQNNDASPHSISRQVGNVAIKSMKPIIQSMFLVGAFPARILCTEQEWNLYVFR